MINHDPSLKTPCEECGKGFSSSRALTRHKKLHMNLEFPCDDCGKVFSLQEKLNRHIRGAHGPGYWSPCKLFHFKWPGQLKKHEDECTDCGIEKDK